MSATTDPRVLDRAAFKAALAWYEARGLVAAAEGAEILACFDPGYPFAVAMGLADSFHVHIKVDDVMRLPHDEIAAFGGKAENAKDGYIKYAHAGGLNLIFSSIPVAEDDRLPAPTPRAKPFVDHLGIDLRRETPEVRSAFDALPDQAEALGWAHTSQGGDRPVYCCHVEVGAKHWLYPGAAGTTLEFAYGPLKVNADAMGCDLRPIDPRHPQAAQAGCCGTPAGEEAPAEAGASFYQRADLARFGELGKAAPELWEKFMAYYTAVTGTDGALTRREKALIALAVAHAKQCPYCIDAYTDTCLDVGANADQMHEAVHVAAALSAGIDLVHGTQMQRVLRERHAL